MTVLELIGLCAVSDRRKLMTHTNCKYRHFLLAELCDLVCYAAVVGRISRTLSYHHSVNAKLQYLFSLCECRQHGKLIASAEQLLSHRIPHAQIEHRNSELSLALGLYSRSLFAGNALDRIFDSVALYIRQSEACSLADDLSVHNAVLTDHLGELAGIYTAQSDYIFLL